MSFYLVPGLDGESLSSLTTNYLTITVPAGKVDELLINFPLMVYIPQLAEIETEFIWFENSDSEELDYERRYDDMFVIKCDLSPAIDNEITVLWEE